MSPKDAYKCILCGEIRNIFQTERHSCACGKTHNVCHKCENKLVQRALGEVIEPERHEAWDKLNPVNRM